jgi:hypothetical protein
VSRNVRRDDENDVEPDAPRPSRNAAKPERPSRDDRASELADAQKKLDEENARHADRLDELSRQLKDAQLSDNAREVRKAERAIEKESTTYEAKKVILERRVRELGGGTDAGAPPAPSGSGKSAGRSRR